MTSLCHRPVSDVLLLYDCCVRARVRASVKDWFTTELCVAGKKSTENLIQEALEKVSECAEALEYMSSHHGIDTCSQSTGLPTGNHHTTVSGRVCVLSQRKTAPTNHW